MFISFMTACFICAVAAMVKVPAADVTEQIIALEKASLQRWINGDPTGFIEVAAADITYFDPTLPQRLNGREAFAAYMNSLKGNKHADSFQLLNPVVVSRENMAVLSFNYQSEGTATGSQPDSVWNCSEVYVKEEGGWKLIQSHWSVARK